MSTTHNIDTHTVHVLISRFEQHLSQALSVERYDQTFDRRLVIDMRGGWIETFCLSMQSDGTLFTEAQAVIVEESSTAKADRERAPLCAYLPAGSKAWAVCSVRRFQELSEKTDMSLADDFFAKAASFEDATQRMRFWAAFLPKSIKTEPYKQVIVLVEDNHQSNVLQPIMPLMVKSYGEAWASPLCLTISPAQDLQGYAFFRHPREVTKAKARYLVVESAESAIALEVRNGTFKSLPVPLNTNLKLDAFDQIAFIGLEASYPISSNILVYKDQADYKAACVIGYVYRNSCLDEDSLEKLKQQRQLLVNQLTVEQSQTAYLQALYERLERVVQMSHMKFLKESAHVTHRN